jgi:hypothetical protein
VARFNVFSMTCWDVAVLAAAESVLITLRCLVAWFALQCTHSGIAQSLHQYVKRWSASLAWVVHFAVAADSATPSGNATFDEAVSASCTSSWWRVSFWRLWMLLCSWQYDSLHALQCDVIVALHSSSNSRRADFLDLVRASNPFDQRGGVDEMMSVARDMSEAAVVQSYLHNRA